MILSIQPNPTPTLTELHIGKGLLEGDLLLELCKKVGHRIVLIADESLKDLYAKHLSEKIKARLFYIPSGEDAKTREIKEKLEDSLLKEGYGRDTVIIALGGGATTDAVGFLASTYLRGVPLILIPTTLLAMVDAAIGGKTALNTLLGKNQLGTIYHPKAIIADLTALDTLPEIEKLNGMAEVLKMGLILKPELFDMKDLEDLITSAAQGKISVIEQDPYETGLRRILNFGHTIGHALEKISEYRLPHGLAVAIGCTVESYLSMHLEYLSKDSFERILSFYTPFLPFHLPKSYNREDFLNALSFDKKKQESKIRFVLIDQIGKAMPFNGAYCQEIKSEDLNAALAWMEKTYE